MPAFGYLVMEEQWAFACEMPKGMSQINNKSINHLNLAVLLINRRELLINRLERHLRKVYADQHPTNRALVAPVRLVRHIGHWRSRPHWWHFLHTECPHGTRATRWSSSWQMGQWPTRPCEFVSVAVSTTCWFSAFGSTFQEAFTWRQNMFLLNLKGIASKSSSSKPSSFILFTNRQIAWFLPAEGSFGSLKSTVQELFDLLARFLHCVLKSLRVTSTHRFTSASLASKAICPSSAAKDIAVAWHEDLWAQRCLKIHIQHHSTENPSNSNRWVV